MISNPEQIVERLCDLQRQIRRTVVDGRHLNDRASVSRQSSADTIYGIDAEVEPILERFFDEWGRQEPIVVIAEGLEPESGRVFPEGALESEARLRIIMDPVDGTRGLMYDKRAAWCLAGVAPNKGDATRLSDIEVAVMAELPTSKMGFADVLWAIKGRGTRGVRESLSDGTATALAIRPSQAETISHGFAMVSNFFPGTKVMAGELMEHLVQTMMGSQGAGQALVFEDQYISTGGQFYELLVGHDRFNADLRPLMYRVLGATEGLCCHPYDCAAMLVATEAGVVLTDGLGAALDGPLDVTTGLSWAGFANEGLRGKMEEAIVEFFARRGVSR